MKNLRAFATPLTIGAFLLLSVTGVLMFFHLDKGLNKLAHEWLGWALVAGGLAHLAVNWRPFVGYWKRPLGAGVMLLFAAVLGLSFVVPAGQGGGKSPMQAVAEAVTAAPLATLASLARTTPDEVAARLTAAGAVVRDPQRDTIESLAGPDRHRRMELIRAVLTR